MEIAHNNFEIQYTVSSNGRNVFTQTSQSGLPYWGMKDSGLTFISYNVPQTLPVSENLSATVKIKGDIEAFINKYGPTQIVIQKGSDL
jgi:hypothetical protein